MNLPTTKPNDRDLEWYIEECIDLKKQLEMECAAKREHLRIACAEINELKVKVGFYERENAALRADKERLDFLATLTGSGWACLHLNRKGTNDDWLLTRKQIDRRMATEPKP